LGPDYIEGDPIVYIDNYIID